MSRHDAVQVVFHRLFVDFDNRLDQLFAILDGLFLQVFRNLDDVPLGAERFVAPDESVHFDQVDNALELGFSADRQLHDDGDRTQGGS